jgi:toxoflavin biosynthesis protein ToxC
MRTIDVGLTRNSVAIRHLPHGSPITGLEWSPDGTMLATSSYDGTVKLWDVPAMTVRHTLCHMRLANGVRWSHHGRWIATSSADRTCRVWDAAGGRCLAVLARHPDDVNTMAWSADDTRLVTVGEDGLGLFWGMPSGELEEGLIAHDDHCMSADWNASTGTIATCGEDATVRLWDEKGTSLAVWAQSTDMEAVRWSPDGSLLAVAFDDGYARLYTADGTCTATIGPVATAVKSIAWSPDGRHLAMGAYDSSCTIWDAGGGGGPLARIQGPRVWARSIGWSPDGHWMALGTLDGEPALARIPTLAKSGGPAPGTVPVPAGTPTYGINAVQPADTSGVLLAGDDGLVRLWDLTVAPDGEETAQAVPAQPDGEESLINTLAFDSRTQAIGYGTFAGTVKVRDRGSGRLLATAALDAPINQVAWRPGDDELAVVTYEGELVFLRLGTGSLTVRHRSHPHAGPVKSVQWLDPDTVVTGATDATIKLIRRDGQVLRVLTGHGSLIDSVSVTSDGGPPLIASTSRDRTIRVWDAATGTCERVLMGHDESLKCAAWQPGSRTVLLSGGYDFDARVWDLAVDERDPAYSSVLTHHRHGVGAITWWSGRPVTASWDASCVVWATDGASWRADRVLVLGQPR